MRTQCYIEIPKSAIPAAVEAAYDLSVPAGMGFIHARGGKLDEETRDALIRWDDPRTVVHMDYVHGRQCKFWIRRHEDKFYVDPRWYDHSHYQLVDLLERIGIKDAEAKINTAIAAEDNGRIA